MMRLGIRSKYMSAFGKIVAKRLIKEPTKSQKRLYIVLMNATASIDWQIQQQRSTTPN